MPNFQQKCSAILAKFKNNETQNLRELEGFFDREFKEKRPYETQGQFLRRVSGNANLLLKAALNAKASKEVVEYILNESNLKKFLLKRNANLVFKYAVTTGNSKLLEKLSPQFVATQISDYYCQNFLFLFEDEPKDLDASFLRRVIEAMSEDQKRGLFETLRTDSNQNPLLRVVRLGSLESMRLFLELLESREIGSSRQIIRGDIYNNAFKLAAISGNLEVLHFIKNLIPEDRRAEKIAELIAREDYSVAFSAAGEFGHLEVLRDLGSPNQIAQLIESAAYYAAFFNAAANGHLEVLQFLISLAPKGREWEILGEIVGGTEYRQFFNKAAANGHAEVLRFLVELVPQEWKEEILGILFTSPEYLASFYSAAANGHAEVLRFLVELAPQERRAAMLGEIIRDHKYLVSFYNAASNGHAEVLQFLLDLIPQELKMQTLDQIIARPDYLASFYNAAVNGHAEVLQFLLDLVPQERKLLKLGEIVAIYESSNLFRDVATKGHTEVLQFLIGLIPQDQVDAILRLGDEHSFYIRSFCEAVLSGNLEAFHFLKSNLNSEQLRDVMHRNGNNFFITNFHNSAVEMLEEIMPHFSQERLREIIAQVQLVCDEIAADFLLCFIDKENPAYQTLINAIKAQPQARIEKREAYEAFERNEFGEIRGGFSEEKISLLDKKDAMIEHFRGAVKSDKAQGVDNICFAQYYESFLQISLKPLETSRLQQRSLSLVTS